jgi:hypothetical protein
MCVCVQARDFFVPVPIGCFCALVYGWKPDG